MNKRNQLHQLVSVLSSPENELFVRIDIFDSIEVRGRDIILHIFDEDLDSEIDLDSLDDLMVQTIWEHLVVYIN